MKIIESLKQRRSVYKIGKALPSLASAGVGFVELGGVKPLTEADVAAIYRLCV